MTSISTVLSAEAYILFYARSEPTQRMNVHAPRTLSKAGTVEWSLSLMMDLLYLGAHVLYYFL